MHYFRVTKDTDIYTEKMGVNFYPRRELLTHKEFYKIPTEIRLQIPCEMHCTNKNNTIFICGFRVDKNDLGK